MAVWRIVEAKHREHPLDGHTRRVHRNENHRLLFVPGCVRIAAPHEDRDAAAWITGAGDPPLASVDDVVVALPRNAGADVRRVRGRNLGLGHRKAGANLAGEQRLEPLLLLFGRAVPDEHFHVAGVGRRTVEHLRREPRRAAHDLAQRRVLGVGESRPVVALRQKQVPQSRRARVRLQLLDDPRGLPAITVRDFGAERRLVGIDVLCHETGETLPEILHLW
jgi:hypothetical protein